MKINYGIQYNIQADMPNKPLPPLNPQTHQPMNADDLSHSFPYLQKMVGGTAAHQYAVIGAVLGIIAAVMTLACGLPK